MVSVVVPMRNEASQAAACLDSLVQLTYEPLEVVVVDDRSTDATAALVEAWLTKQADNRFLLVRAPEDPPQGWVGKAFAVDHAINRSRGQLVLIADADVRHTPESLAESMAALGSGDMLVRPPLARLSNAGNVLADFLLFTIWVASRTALAAGGLPLSFGAYVLMRRSFYDAVGGFSAQRAFPESLPLARLAAAHGRYRLARPSPSVSADLYPSFAAAARGTLRNINFSLVSPQAGLASFVCIGVPLFALGELWLAWGVLAAWIVGVACYERACGRSMAASILLALVAPLSAWVLAAVSCAALVRLVCGLPVTWRGRVMRVQ